MVDESEVHWPVPGPGLWEHDGSHFAGGATLLLQELATRSMADGMRRVFVELGAPVDTLQPAFVNGHFYARLRPLISPDKPAKKLPPLLVLKVATRLHPEMRRRSKSAAAMLDARPWRQVVSDWETGGRRDVEDANLAFQDVDLAALADDELMVHVAELYDYARRSWEHHFWLHGYDLGPIGLLLYSCDEWGIPPADVIPLLEGASPSSTAPIAALHRIRSAVEASGADPASLDEMRSISPEVAADIAAYLRYRGCVLFSRYDVDGFTLSERPDLVLQTVMAGQERTVGRSVAERIAEVRERVPAEHRLTFDERLTEARAAMNLRDDNGPNTAEWPLGLLRLALLEVGRRMVVGEIAHRQEHAFELAPSELDPSLLLGGGPSADQLAARLERRRWQATLDPPPSLGTTEVAPPLSVLPAAQGRLVGMIQLVMQQLGMAGDRDALGAGLRGTGIGAQPYRGIARRAGSPEEAIDSLEPGDVLVVPFTTPAYNVVLSIAGAIVTSVGGPLSHAAVLARELGIPAVIGAPRALVDIEDGAEVEVDPIEGVVRIITPARV